MKFNYFTGIIALLFVFSSCKKTKDEEVTPVIIPNKQQEKLIAMGMAKLHLHVWIGDDSQYQLDLANDSIYSGERRMSLSIGNMYLSDFELVKTDGSIYQLPDTVIFWEHPNLAYDLGKVPTGEYKSIKFKIGLDSLARSREVASAYRGILNKPSMWFESNSNPEKYVYFYLKGKIDTASIPDENNNRIDYELKIRTKSQLIQIEPSKSIPNIVFNVTENGELFHTYMDLNVLFSGINLSDSKSLKVVSLEENKSTLADKIASNISKMFHYE